MYVHIAIVTFADREALTCYLTGGFEEELMLLLAEPVVCWVCILPFFLPPLVPAELLLCRLLRL